MQETARLCRESGKRPTAGEGTGENPEELCRQAVELLRGIRGNASAHISSTPDSVHDELAAAYLWLGVCIRDRYRGVDVGAGGEKVKDQNSFLRGA